MGQREQEMKSVSKDGASRGFHGTPRYAAPEQLRNEHDVIDEGVKRMREYFAKLS